MRTGRFRFVRRGLLRKRMVLEVQCRKPEAYGLDWTYYWRRAKPHEADEITIALQGKVAK